MSAQISTLPALLIHFDQLSLVAPLANLLIAGPFIPFAMLSGFLSAITSLISVPLAKLVGFPGYISLSYIIQVVEITSQIPYAALKILWFHSFGVIVYYALLGTILILKFRKESKQQQIEKTPCIQTLKKSSGTCAGENS
jgi:competence protein ComEC